MMHAIELEGVDSSSPVSSKTPTYYVQSPPHDSQEDDKSLSHSSSANGRKSNSSGTGSRISGSWMSGSWMSGKFGRIDYVRKGYGRKKSAHECDVIEEEDYDEYYYGVRGVSRQCRCFIFVLGFGFMFGIFCLSIWGAGKPFDVEINVKSLTVHNFYVGQGSDLTGVPTKMLTVNISVNMSMHNPATFFGVHVHSAPVELMYSKLIIASGEIKKYYQPRKSQQSVYINLGRNMVPLYGAGPSLAMSDSKGGVPMRLEFDVRSQGNLVGKLVKSKRRKHVSCAFFIRYRGDQLIKMKENSCTYYRVSGKKYYLNA